MFLASAEAGDRLGTAGTGNTHAADVGQNHWNNPNNSIGNCTKDGKFCWNIQIGNEPHWGFPIEYYGNRARRLIADGQKLAIDRKQPTLITDSNDLAFTDLAVKAKVITEVGERHEDSI